MKHSNSSRRSEQNAEQNIKMKQKNNLEQNGNKTLEHHLKQVKQENYNESFPKVENWLYKAGIQLENNNQTNQNENLRNERKLQKMKNFFFANKLRLVYTVILLAVLVAACNMPVTQTENAGHMLTFTVPAENTDVISKINALPWMKNAQVTANENTGSDGSTQILYTAVLQNTTKDQITAYAKEIEALGNITTMRIKAMDYDVKRPLYSAALDNFFSIKIDATGMSDEELAQEIHRQMKEQGVDMKFYVKTGPDGRRDFLMEHDPNSKDPHQFELTIDENNGNEKIKMFQKKVDPGKFNGKTDGEIRKMVKEEHPELQDKDIKIIRDGDKVQVKVEKDKKEIRE
jgi:hypothetical protein